MNNKLSDFWKTKSFIETMDARAKGWKPTSQLNGIPGPFIYLYAYDRPTQWAWTCRVAKDSFVKMSSSMLETPHLVEDVRDALANVLGSAADGKPPADIGGADWGQQLGSMLTLYAGTTQTWNAANRFRADGGHFIVLNYRRAGQLSGRLRPFAIPSFEGIIPAEQFDAMVAKVIATDKINHPEWLSA